MYTMLSMLSIAKANKIPITYRDSKKLVIDVNKLEQDLKLCQIGMH